MKHNVESKHEEIIYSGNKCKNRSTLKESLRTHRTPNDEESYFVTKGNAGQFQLVCKECEASFSSQKAVIQHVMKHGRDGSLDQEEMMRMLEHCEKLYGN